MIIRKLWHFSDENNFSLSLALLFFFFSFFKGLRHHKNSSPFAKAWI